MEIPLSARRAGTKDKIPRLRRRSVVRWRSRREVVDVLSARRACGGRRSYRPAAACDIDRRVGPEQTGPVVLSQAAGCVAGGNALTNAAFSEPRPMQPTGVARARFRAGRRGRFNSHRFARPRIGPGIM